MSKTAYGGRTISSRSTRSKRASIVGRLEWAIASELSATRAASNMGVENSLYREGVRLHQGFVQTCQLF